MLQLNSGDTAWVLASSALVLFMTPGLAFFYGGMVRAKSVLNMLMMSFLCIGLVSVLWVLYGYSEAFGPDAGKGSGLSGPNDSASGLFGHSQHVGLIGNLHNAGLNHGTGNVYGVGDPAQHHGVPLLAFSAFQLMFAIITPALISGAIADRAKFGAWVLFVGLWVTIVYFPVAHWVFSVNGWINGWLGAFDFAGGTAVHINAGAAALALTFVLGKRKGWPREQMKPHNLPLVLLGAGILWFGWFGFNAGSALAGNDQAAVAFMNTQLATAAAALAWIGVEKLRDGHATTLGVASGAVAGLVAITPACATVSPMGSLVVGGVAGGLCAFAVGLKYKLGFDDSLDVVGVHLVGGIAGSLIIGLLATKTVGASANGLFYGGGFAQLGKQAVAVLAVGGYSFVVSFVLGKLVDKVIGFRIPEEDEMAGVDGTTHAESAYEFGSLGGTLAAAARSIGLTAPAQSTERVDA